MLRNVAITLLGAFIACAVACGSEQPPSTFGSSGTPEEDAGTSSGVFKPDSGLKPPPPLECTKMDIVFVVDNSSSMDLEQANLAKNFPEFIKIINEYKTAKGEELDYRVAVTTSDDGVDLGKFRKGRGQGADQTCNPGPNNQPWLTRKETDINGFFACRAQVGALGSNMERLLQSAKLAVTDRIADGANTFQGESFVREDALLAFVLLSDEDEGSADNGQPPPAPIKDVALYTGDFDNVKAGLRGRWAAAAIAGEKQCNSPEFGDAAEAKRLKQFINAAGPKNGIFNDICTGDLTPGLKAALALFTAACKEFPGVVK
jgi:hypothetical protein